MSLSTKSSLSPTILTSLPSMTLPFRTSELQPLQIQNKPSSAPYLIQGGLMTRVLSQSWLDHIGLFAMNSLFTMVCSSSTIASSSPPFFVKACCANSMQPTVTVSLLLVMLAAVCFGLASTVKSQTCVNPASFVPEMHSNILVSHSAPIQYFLYHGSSSPKTCLNLMV